MRTTIVLDEGKWIGGVFVVWRAVKPLPIDQKGGLEVRWGWKIGGFVCVEVKTTKCTLVQRVFHCVPLSILLDGHASFHMKNESQMFM